LHSADFAGRLPLLCLCTLAVDGVPTLPLAGECGGRKHHPAPVSRLWLQPHPDARPATGRLRDVRARCVCSCSCRCLEWTAGFAREGIPTLSSCTDPTLRRARGACPRHLDCLPAQALVCGACEHWSTLPEATGSRPMDTAGPPRTLALYAPRPLTIFLSYGHDGFTSVRGLAVTSGAPCCVCWHDGRHTPHACTHLPPFHPGCSLPSGLPHR
jgi:hypothetical protein